VACVGRDMIKVWPLSMKQPWWGDGLEDSDKPTGVWALIPAAFAGSK
jgi:hypothetical protein